jgi:hypothetical protein
MDLHDGTAAVALNAPPPGWYGHPDDRPRIARWWDGRDWSQTTRACIAPLPPPFDDMAAVLSHLGTRSLAPTATVAA